MVARRLRCGLFVLALLGGSGCRESVRVVSLSDPPDAGTAQPPEEGAPTVGGTPSSPPPPVSLGDRDFTPTPTPDGVPGPMPGVYTDKGPADESALIRGLIAFPLRNRAELEASLERMYDPASPVFRKYMTPGEWIDRHAPLEEDVMLVAEWLKARGLDVPRIATNRLLLQFTGTVKQFNDSFGAQLRVLERKSPQGGNPPHDVYGLTTDITAPAFVEERISAVVAADLAADDEPPPGEFGEPPAGPPANIADGLTPQQVARAYGVDSLWQQGFRGRGIKLGVAIGAGYRIKDLQSFWKAFGVNRPDPTIVYTTEPPATRYREGTLDVQWAGVMAPDAELIVYMGHDARNSSMLFTFNEAIARGEVSVLTDSFAHREDSEPRAVHEAYSNAAMMAAALGITVLSASGDSAGVDVPANSPYVTAVGGTRLVMDGMRVVSEEAWTYSGSGITRTFPMPEWQKDLAHIVGTKRGVVDVALNADTGYWYMFLGVWTPNTGTSFASPVFAGIVASMNSARAAQGKPPLGWLNPLLYTTPAAQATFRDMTAGATEKYAAGPGWDLPTGWGAPSAEGLLRTLP